jgi:hypothetical protein
MKAAHSAKKAGAAAPKKGEARTAGTVSSPKFTSRSEQRQHTKPDLKVKAPDSRTRVIASELAKPRLALSEYVTPPEKVRALKDIRDTAPGNTGAAQEARILQALSRWSLTTFEASRYLDSYDPRARVMSLRGKGHAIVTSWTLVRTECGRLHRVGIYTLQRGRVPATHPQHALPAGAAVAASPEQEAQE